MGGELGFFFFGGLKGSTKLFSSGFSHIGSNSSRFGSLVLVGCITPDSHESHPDTDERIKR